MTATGRLSAPRLPDFPWDSLAPYAARAAAHPDGLVDLSVGTPVDPTPASVQAALAAAADAPGYPAAAGTAALRQAVVDYLARRFAVRGLEPAGVIPTVGSKEMVALLPQLLGCGPGTVVGVPALAYPTYAVGAINAGATPVTYRDVAELDGSDVGLVWVNSPANPTGEVLDAAALRRVVSWARARGAVVASDECYAELGWTAQPVSVLHADIAGDGLDGIVALHSLSKRSNLAGYRAGFLAGDPALVGPLLERRRHLGLLVPSPVQAAMVAALSDDAHVAEQRERYRRRREVLVDAFASAGWTLAASAGGLYLWASDGADCWDAVGRLADLGVLVAPGVFYGPDGTRHVRVALTATDERVTAAAARLRTAGAAAPG